MADTGNVISIREFYKVDAFTTRPFKGNPLKFVTSRQQQMPLCGDATIASLCVLKLKGYRTESLTRKGHHELQWFMNKAGTAEP